MRGLGDVWDRIAKIKAQKKQSLEDNTGISVLVIAITSSCLDRGN